jgi:hypothetical protein
LSRRLHRRFGPTLLVALGAFAGAVAPARAGTLTSIKDGHVWVSAPDGSDAHLVTATGTGWRSPTLADDGTVYVYGDSAYDKRVHVFPPGRPEAAPISIRTVGGLLSLDVAPDRSGLAWMYIDSSPLDHRLLENSSVKRLADGHTWTLLADWWPTWRDARHVEFAGVNGSGFYDPATDAVTPWFGSLPFSWDDGEETVTTRLGDKTAIRYQGDILASTESALALADTSVGAPGTGPGCHSSTEFTFQKLTWSPDGSSLAWEQADGIHEMQVGGLGSGCANVHDPVLAIAGASSPDWGPSDDRRFPNATSVASPVGDPPGGEGSGGGGSGETTERTIAPRLSLRPVTRLSRSRALAHGITLRVSSTTSGRLTATATVSPAAARAMRLHGRTVARGTSTIARAGTGAVTLHFSAAARKRLRRAGPLSLTVRASIGSLGATATVKLVRR